MLEARDIMRGQKEEINNLKDSIRAVTHCSEIQLEIMSSVLGELKGSLQECEAFKREVLILSQRVRVF